jgi:hypothetical protein
MKAKVLHKDKVNYVYWWLRNNTNWIPLDADNVYDRECVESLVAMFKIQDVNDWPMYIEKPKVKK